VILPGGGHLLLYAGKWLVAAAQEAGGGRSQWDGVLPTRTLLVEWPAGQDTPTGYRVSNLPATTPVTDLVRWARMHRHPTKYY
jgi:hypothetical protein